MTWIHETLRVFFEVAERGNFTEAAKHLHITQSAVSQHIKNLEEDLDTILIDRSNRRAIRLTPAGQIAYDHARRILHIEEEMRLRIADTFNVIRGVLVIGVSYTVGEYILPSIISEFWDRHPEIELHVEIYNTPAVAQAVGGRTLDIGLVESTVNTQSSLFRVEEVAHDNLVLIVPVRHPLAARPAVSLREISHETWILREEGSGTREFTDRFFAEHDIEPSRTMAFSSTQGIKEAVRAGLGVAFISSWALLTESAFRTVQVVQLDNVELTRPLSLITQPNTVQSRASRAFADYVRQWFVSKERSLL